MDLEKERDFLTNLDKRLRKIPLKRSTILVRPAVEQGI